MAPGVSEAEAMVDRAPKTAETAVAVASVSASSEATMAEAGAPEAVEAIIAEARAPEITKAVAMAVGPSIQEAEMKAAEASVLPLVQGSPLLQESAREAEVYPISFDDTSRAREVDDAKDAELGSEASRAAKASRVEAQRLKEKVEASQGEALRWKEKAEAY
ncbi:uncharacterized protein [Miscanthus floridulus]|uniref:uncharacterized protein n=1 Tax=Miscanthus floridulus TaxID=154761 RepID=UPI00345A3FA2